MTYSHTFPCSLASQIAEASPDFAFLVACNKINTTNRAIFIQNIDLPKGSPDWVSHVPVGYVLLRAGKVNQVFKRRPDRVTAKALGISKTEWQCVL